MTLSPAQSAHLALLCKARRLELMQAIHLAGGALLNRYEAALRAELAVNSDCLALLEPSSAVRAA